MSLSLFIRSNVSISLYKTQCLYLSLYDPMPLSLSNHTAKVKSGCNKRCPGGKKCRQTLTVFRGMKLKKQGCFCPKGSMVSDTGCQGRYSILCIN